MNDLLRLPTPPLTLQAPDRPDNTFPSPAAIKPLSPGSEDPKSLAASRSRSLLAVATPARRGKLQLGE